MQSTSRRLVPRAALGALGVLWRFSRPHTLIGTSLSIVALYAIAASLDRASGAADLLWTLLAGACVNVFIVGINQVVWEPAANTLHFESDEQLDHHARVLDHLAVADKDARVLDETRPAAGHVARLNFCLRQIFAAPGLIDPKEKERSERGQHPKLG